MSLHFQVGSQRDASVSRKRAFFTGFVTAQMMHDLFAPQPTDLLPLMVTIHFKSERYFSHPLWPVGGSNNLEFTFTPASSPSPKHNAASSDSIEAKMRECINGVLCNIFQYFILWKESAEKSASVGERKYKCKQISDQAQMWSLINKRWLDVFFFFSFQSGLICSDIFRLNDFNFFFSFKYKWVLFSVKSCCYSRFFVSNDWFIFFSCSFWGILYCCALFFQKLLQKQRGKRQ